MFQPEVWCLGALVVPRQEARILKTRLGGRGATVERGAASDKRANDDVTMNPPRARGPADGPCPARRKLIYSRWRLKVFVSPAS